TLSLVYETSTFGDATALVLYNGEKQEIWNTSWVAFGGVVSSNYTINQTVIGPYYLVVMAKDNGNEYNLTTEIKSQNDAGQNKDAGDTLSSALEIFGGTNSGFLANEDVDDYYKFTVPASGIFKLNLSVSDKYSNPITFDVFNDTKQMIRRIPDLAPGATQFYSYTINDTANRVFYTRAKIVSGKNEYNITLTFNVQDDAVTGGDASDNLSNAVTIATQNVEYTGWLGGGNKGDDDADAFIIPLSITENKMRVNFSITTNSSLDITVYIYNDSFGLLVTKDIGGGAQLVHELNILTLPALYLKLSVDPGKSSEGDYSIKYIAVGVSPSEIDEDGDNLPDEWEISNSLNASDATGINGSTGDPDNDGLKNLGEYNNGADPNDPDSDADGMKDGWEIDNTLDPVADDSSQDPDEDGYTNLQEYQNQTDP
ncbi:MAG: hypothetical protein KAJ51_03320, partial [Thermoplasmata archaeon]|nr:hypothetical protein [Thermoplasmata archaeon]